MGLRHSVKTYFVEIIETLSKVVEVAADNDAGAISIVTEKYKSEEYILDYSDYIDTLIQIVDE